MNVDIAVALFEKGYTEARQGTLSVSLGLRGIQHLLQSMQRNGAMCLHTEASVQEAIKSCSTLEEEPGLAVHILCKCDAECRHDNLDSR